MANEQSGSPQSEENNNANNSIDTYNQNQGFIVQQQPQLAPQNNNQLDLTCHQNNIGHQNHTGHNLNSQGS